MNETQIQQLAQALVGAITGKSQKAVGSSPNYTYGYTAGGLFATPGLERPLFSTMLMPIFGLQSRLPVKASNYTNPTYAIITGVGASTGTNPVGVCDDPKTVGLATLCTQTAFFGRWSLQTAVIDIDQIGKKVNRGVMTDLQLMNGPVGNDGGLLPTAPGMSTLAGAIKTELNKILFEFGVAWARDYGRQLYTGNPLNNTAGGGYKEFLGINALVNTGRVDAVTGTLCPASDSIVWDFASANISGSANAANAAALVARIVAVWRNLKYIASRTGLNPVKWVLTMPDQLFYEITAMWPCNYLTNQCQGAIGTTLSPNVVIQVNGADAVKMRDEMRNGNFLWVDGAQLEVIIDEAITPVTADAGATYTAPMYFIPLTVLGNTDVTYIEYFDYGQPGGSLEAAQVLAPDGSYSVSDNGRFLWHKKPPTNFCVQLLAKTETRLIMLTPFLAARIINIKYAPLMVTRSPYPGDSNYVAGGSATSPTSWIPVAAP